MLLKFLRRALGAAVPDEERVADVGLLERAAQLMMAGDDRGAIRMYAQYLETDPFHLGALNDMGACLAGVGDTERATAAFELAYSLDDTFTPAMVNRAKLLNDRHRSDEALELLRRAKVVDPSFNHADNVYAGVQLKRGLTRSAREWQLKSWLAHFDNLRSGNSHLFWMGYDDVDEAELAAEHRFWAETVKPVPPDAAEATPSPRAGRRLRIGYWSPDFRNHSVRYFFRPLLEHHDRGRVEVFLYHDYPGEDEQTRRIRDAAEHFHPVHELTDDALRELVVGHGLDVLVDLAGHTSHNRIAMLQRRMARVQMNALGYPPTTGLRSIDAKLVDRHVLTDEAPLFYTERPLALPGSFWCFDPDEEAPLADAPPCEKLGHVTFGSVGNVAKITPPVARTWAEVLARVPGSRLQIRSMTFLDPAAEAITRRRLADDGLPMDRVDFERALGGRDFLDSYNGIDIVLDTFPFNGGTTSCFAVYMGVPVVSLTGRSLIGRMGLSVMSNVGAPHLSVATHADYVDTAVRLAGDRSFLGAFKREARSRCLAGPLGDGAQFAAHFEQACEELVARAEAGAPAYETRVALLPAREIIRRAYGVLRAGQLEAGERILSHCLAHYPRAGAAHLLQAQLLVWSSRFDDAVRSVEQVLPVLAPEDLGAAHAALARMHLLRNDIPRARSAVEAARAYPAADTFDRMQLALYEAALADHGRADAPPAALGTGHVRVVVPTADPGQFETLREQIERDAACPAGWTLEVERCDPAEAARTYQARLADPGIDVLLIVQRNVQLRRPAFLSTLLHALQDADVVGCTGARRWSRLEWRADGFEQKAGGFVGRSSEREGAYELHLLGPGAAVEPGMAVLSGSLVGVRSRGREAPRFDEELQCADTLLEEAWTHQAAREGWRLAACGDLGVFVNPDVELEGRDRGEARLRWNEAMGFDPFVSVRDDHVSVSVPAATLDEAVEAARRYFRGADGSA